MLTRSCTGMIDARQPGIAVSPRRIAAGGSDQPGIPQQRGHPRQPRIALRRRHARVVFQPIADPGRPCAGMLDELLRTTQAVSAGKTVASQPQHSPHLIQQPRRRRTTNRTVYSFTLWGIRHSISFRGIRTVHRRLSERRPLSANCLLCYTIILLDERA